MIKNDHHIDHMFRENQLKQEVTPPSFLWDNIASTLNKEKAQRRQLLIWRSVAAIAIALLIPASILITINNNQAPFIASTPTTSQINNSTTHKTINKAKAISNSIDETNKKAKNNKITSSQKLAKQTTNTFAPIAIKETTEQKIEIPLIKIDHKNIDFNEEFAINTDILKSAYKEKVYYPLYFAEIESPKKKKHSNISVGGAISPTYNYGETATNHSDASLNMDKSMSNTSLGGGVNVRINSKSKWSFESGVLYSRLGQESVNNSPTQVLASVDPEPTPPSSSIRRVSPFRTTIKEVETVSQKEMIESSNIQSLSNAGISINENTSLPNEISRIEQTLEYLEVPLLARYTLIEGKPTINISGGFSPNILVGNHAKVIDQSNTKTSGQTQNIKPVTFSSSLGMGVELPINRTISFSLEPRLKYYLNSISTNENMTYKPYSIGVFGGVTIHL